MSLIDDIKRDRECQSCACRCAHDEDCWRFWNHKALDLSRENGRLRAVLLAAEELATDLSICADNAADAAKTDPRWEGVADKLRARVAAWRKATGAE